jgi:hypothetical protein
MPGSPVQAFQGLGGESNPSASSPAVCPFKFNAINAHHVMSSLPAFDASITFNDAMINHILQIYSRPALSIHALPIIF